MKAIDPVLLNTAVSYCEKAYDNEIEDAIKIESKLTSTTVFIIKRKTIDIIAFRGTQQARDWLFNLSAIPIPYANRLCHSGFVMAHISVWSKIKKHLDMKKRTLVCGHSLGGALAELTAAKLHRKHPNLNLCTFGKPNTFFKGFKKPLKLDRQMSVVLGSDVVAKIPRICYGPSVSQTMLYFANSGKDMINPARKERANDSKVSDMVSDHFMPNYKERVKRWAKNRKRKL